MSTLSDFTVLEDCLVMVKGPNGETVIILPTCSSIKYDNTHTLAQILTEIQQRITNLENNMTWNGPAQSNS